MGNSLPSASQLQQYRGGWLLCLDESQRVRCINRLNTSASGPNAAARAAADNARREAQEHIDGLMKELFRLQDLNKNGLLEEEELVKLNQKIAMLHYGRDSKDADRQKVETKYRNHFREHLDPEGKPVDYEKFKDYMGRILNGIDPDPRVHEMTLEQWIAEAESGRAAFFCASMSSQSDFEFLQNMSFRESKVFGAPPPTAGSSMSARTGNCLSPGGPSEASTLPSEPLRLHPSEQPRFPGDQAPTPQFASGLHANESFCLERLPPEAGSVDLSEVPSSRPPTSSAGSAVSGGRSGFMPPTAGSGVSNCPPLGTGAFGGAGADRSSGYARGPDESIGSFIPHPGLQQSGYSSVDRSSVMDSFLPHPSRAVPGGSMLDSRDSYASSFASPPVQHQPVAARSVCAFRQGEALDVWSGTKQAWLPGTVQAAFESETTVEGYTVPAGTLKVHSAAGVKWVLPEQIEKMLRRSGYARGEQVEVWSDSNRAWLDGVIEEAYAETTQGNGFTIPAGSVLVKSSAGTTKWLMPDQISKMLRRADPTKISTSQVVPSLTSTVSLSPGFTNGEKIRVWSDSRQQWLLGVVQAVFVADSKAEGFEIPAGTVKVLSETGEKWVLPKDRDRVLCKADVPAEVDLKSMLKSALQDPSALQRQADSVWSSALLPGQKVLPVDHAAYALEGLADQFGVRMELEGNHLQTVKQRAQSYAQGCDGLSKEQFQGLCREMMSDLYGSFR
eukprot:TRINITY_DN36971_c0_g1_i1.p1 TRINITY_DN36971_c0_g1~~TRINITY_DN36971_c0_g1_i1.p1  ORF type:complete len:737 (-),score=135.45 TRINITY_DN36971_c0_g1_i1:28-2214(-)